MALGNSPVKRLSLLVCTLFSLCACTSGPQTSPPPKLPYDSWYVGLAAPRHMEVWVESVDVLDQRGVGFFNVFGGVASYTGKTEGWHKGGGAMMPVNNVDLPERIFVRWQSLVEPQTYKVGIKIPQWVRDEMIKPKRIFCKWDQEIVTLYRDTITLGLAPGGIVKVWVGSGCLEHKEVGRFQAEIETLGPYQTGKGIYYRAPNPKAQAWINEHGIPYGSW
ncbi:DUF2931 family protein [Pseudomonas huanghezhanensis]|uniref:DUF2931 family protein n=1 Tax=Pseudomonas huanghezhanensis TaxID=3002903 RepID=UPI00228663E2|nr:DUF2931 family protein [Pseudomonas sp. BSw22131]